MAFKTLEEKRAYSKRYYRTKYRDKQIAFSKINSTRIRARNRQYVHDYLASHPCVDCNFSDIRALDFDHVKGQKISTVSQLVNSAWSLDKIENEIAKCEVRCANCHRIVTRERELFSRNSADRVLAS